MLCEAKSNKGNFFFLEKNRKIYFIVLSVWHVCINQVDRIGICGVTITSQLYYRAKKLFQFPPFYYYIHIFYYFSVDNKIFYYAMISFIESWNYNRFLEDFRCLFFMNKFLLNTKKLFQFVLLWLLDFRLSFFQLNYVLVRYKKFRWLSVSWRFTLNIHEICI